MISLRLFLLLPLLALIGPQEIIRMVTVVGGTTWGYGVDVYTAISQSNFQCMYNNGYSVAFVRVYKPDGGGSVDGNGATNVINALAAGLGVEVFVQPSPQSVKTGATQFDEANANLANNSISASQIWLLVTQPMIWSLDPTVNMAFINSFLNEARSNNMTVGIYTSWYDWYLITYNSTTVQSNGNVMLWYWHTLAIGVGAESAQDFNDYRQVGDWGSATVKQFGIAESVCSSPVNRDIYPTSSSTAAKLAATAQQNKHLANRMKTFPASGRFTSPQEEMMKVGGHITMEESIPNRGDNSSIHLEKTQEIFQWSRP